MDRKIRNLIPFGKHAKLETIYEIRDHPFSIIVFNKELLLRGPSKWRGAVLLNASQYLVKILLIYLRQTERLRKCLELPSRKWKYGLAIAQIMRSMTTVSAFITNNSRFVRRRKTWFRTQAITTILVLLCHKRNLRFLCPQQGHCLS